MDGFFLKNVNPEEKSRHFNITVGTFLQFLQHATNMPEMGKVIKTHMLYIMGTLVGGKYCED